MFATDPLSLVFLGCIMFSGGFLVISTLLGFGHSDGLSHLGHSGHVLHIGGDHAVHIGHADTGHAADIHSHVAHGDTGTQVAPSTWSAFTATLLGALNLYGLLMFLLVFGLAGYVLHNAFLLGVVAILFAIVLAAASAVGTTMLLGRLFRPTEMALLTSDSSRLEGRMGTVTQSIRAGGVGEVLFTSVVGTRQSVGARSAEGDAIARDTEVVILGYQDGIATVQPWEQFLAGVKAGMTPQLGPIEP